jgi:hypothetical protein
MHEPYSTFFPFDFNPCAVGNAHISCHPTCSAVAAFFSSKFEDISVDEENKTWRWAFAFAEARTGFWAPGVFQVMSPSGH